MTEHFWIVGLIGVGLLLIAAQMTVTSKVHYAVKMAFAALAVIGALTAWNITSGLIGYPVAGPPKDNGTILSFILNARAKRIFLWMLESGEPRAYFVPWDDNLAKKLTEAQKQAKGNGGQMTWRNGSNGKGGEDHNGGRSGGEAGIKSDRDGANSDVVPSLPEKD